MHTATRWTSIGVSKKDEMPQIWFCLAFGPVAIGIHIKLTSTDIPHTKPPHPMNQSQIAAHWPYPHLPSPISPCLTYSFPFSPSSDLALAWFHLRGLRHLAPRATLAPRSTPGFRLLQAIHQGPNKRWVQLPEVLDKQNGLVLKWCITYNCITYSDIHSVAFVFNSAIFCALGSNDISTFQQHRLNVYGTHGTDPGAELQNI